MPEPLGVGDIVTSRYAPDYGTGIIVDTDGNRTASMRVLFDDDYDDWYAEAELAPAPAKAKAAA